MTMNSTAASNRTISAKIDLDLAVDFENLASLRGLSLSAALRELIEAAVSGRVIYDLPREATDYSARFSPSKVAADAKSQARVAALVAAKDASVARHTVDSNPLSWNPLLRRLRGCSRRHSGRLNGNDRSQLHRGRSIQRGFTNR